MRRYKRTSYFLLLDKSTIVLYNNKRRGASLIPWIKSLLTRNQVIKGFYFMLLEIIPQVHISPDIKINPVLLLYGTHMGIITFIA